MMVNFTYFIKNAKIFFTKINSNYFLFNSIIFLKFFVFVFQILNLYHSNSSSSIFSLGFDLKEVILSAILDPIKSPAASADFVNIFYLPIFQNHFLLILTYFHIYFDLIQSC